MLDDLSGTAATWFHKPSAMNQSLFALPILGHLTAVQAFMIFGVGLPAMFAAMQFAELQYAVIPLCVAACMAMLRPPVMSYEARAACVVRFLAFGGRGAKRAAPRDSSVLAAPARGKAGNIPAAPAPAPARPIRVIATGKPIEVSMKLFSRDGSPHGSRKVRLLIDGREAKTTVSSAAGEVVIILEPNECVGERIVAVHAVRPDDMIEDESLLERTILFEKEAGPA